MKVHGAVLIRNTFRQLYTNHTHGGQLMTKVIGQVRIYLDRKMSFDMAFL